MPRACPRPLGSCSPSFSWPRRRGLSSACPATPRARARRRGRAVAAPRFGGRASGRRVRGPAGAGRLAGVSPLLARGRPRPARSSGLPCAAGVRAYPQSGAGRDRPGRTRAIRAVPPALRRLAKGGRARSRSGGRGRAGALCASSRELARGRRGGPGRRSQPGEAMAAEGKRLFSSAAAHGAASPGQCRVAVPESPLCCLRPAGPDPAVRPAPGSNVGNRGAGRQGRAGKGGQQPRSSGRGSAAPGRRRGPGAPGCERRDPAGSGLRSPQHRARRARELCRGFFF